MNVKSDNLNKVYTAKKIVALLILFMIVAFSIRMFCSQFREVIATDSYFYATCGKNLIEGRGFINVDGTPHLTNPPLTSLFIGLFWLLFKNLEFSGRMASVAFGSILVIPVYLLAKALWNRKIALIASLLVVFYPGLVNISTQVASDSIYTFFIVSMGFTFWLALNKKRGNWLYFGLTGILLALSYLTRAIGLVYIGVFGLWSLIFYLIKKENIIQLISGIMLILIVFLTVASPYLFFIHKHTGRFSLSPKAASWLKISMAETEEELERAKTSISPPIFAEIEEKNGILEYFISYPKLFISKFAKNLFLLYKRKFPQEVPPLVFIFIGLGLLGLPFSKDKFIKDMFALSMLFPIFVQTLWAPESRYIIPLLPFLIIIAAVGLYSLNDMFLSPLGLKGVHKKAIFILVVFLVIVSFLPSIFKVITMRSDEPIEHKQAGLWLRQFDRSKPLIMARKPWVAFYAEGAWMCLPYGSYEEIIDYAYKKRIKYLVIDEMSITKVRPQLVFLLDENKAPENLRLIYKDKSQGRSILIYEMLNSQYRQN